MKDVVVITGGGSGMGLATARYMSKEKIIVLSGRTVKKLEGAVETLKNDGFEAYAFACDTSSRESVKALAEYAKSLGCNKIALGHHFNDVIETLAQTLEQRDKVYKEYNESGGHPLIEYTNKSGATNLMKHPLLGLWDELNKSALAYWRDLGLTPAGLKKLDTDALKKKKASSFGDFLMSRISEE